MKVSIRMKQTVVLMLFLALQSVCSAAAEPVSRADFYVSPVGSNDWSGTLPNPDARGTDGPFATLERARDAVRDLKERKSTDILVLVREGTYGLGETVVFGLQDSGEGDSTITYAAYPGEKPVFSSGVEIGGWSRLTDAPAALPAAAHGKVWVVDVPKARGAQWRFFTLYDAKGLLPRARAAGFTPLDPPASEKERAYRAKNILHFPKGALKNRPNLEDVEVVIRPHHQWLVNILPLASVNEETQIAQTALAGTYRLTLFKASKKSCWVENVLEALDEPGEWVLNSQEGKLYLWPRDAAPPQGIMTPRLRELIRVEGRIDKEGPEDIPARNLRFRGLTFMHGERYLLAEDDAGLQHDWDMHDRDYALVRLRGAEDCAIEQCRFVHSGGGAIRVDLHGQSNRIVGNHIEHIGGTGILLCGYGPGSKDVNKHNLVYNNNIHHVGEIYWHSPGIFVWQSGENRVANNLIHHTPYSGMIVSGCMTHFFARSDGRELVRTIRWHEVGGGPSEKTLEQVRPFLHTHNNLIEYNEIHHVMEKLGDGNGIYVRGAGAGNVIRRNYIHHLVGPTASQSAIRTDGGQRYTLIAENLIYKCVSQGIKLKLNNRAENNIIADILNPARGYLVLREGPMTGAVIKRNIFYKSSSESCAFVGQDLKPRRGRKPALVKDIDMDDNLYYCAGNPGQSSKALAEYQRDGVDARSLAVDPLFVDPANGDFRFKPKSPALKMGIVPIDLTRIGLRKTEDAKFGAFIHFGVRWTLNGQCKGRGSRHRDAVDRALTSPSQAGNRGGRTGHGAGFGADLHQSGRRRGSAGHMQGAFSSVRRNSRSSINGLSERMIRAPSLRATRGRLNFRIT